MPYGLKYISRFDSFKDDPCMYFEVQILQKDYDGSPIDILLSGVPAVHEWQDDERNKPIKGSTLKIGIINNGVVSLESFYSNYDDEYQVILRQRSTDAILFIGYLIQDECSEIMADFAHEINLTATDMLGTLKDISLGQAAEQYGDLTTYSSVALNALDSVTLYTMDSRVSALKPNQKFTIDTGLFFGSYTLLSITYDSILGWKLWTSPSGFTPFTSDTCDMTWRTPTELMTYISLGKILRLCLQSTKLELGTKSIATIYDLNGDTNRWLDSTCLMGNTFLNNGEWMSCYDVAEAILSRFRATLFQSKGSWWIMRYNELYRGNDAPNPLNYIIGNYYDVEMDFQTTINSDETSLAFNQNNLEFGATKSIERPVAYVRDTFQYQQPDSLLKNPNLDELGDLINQYTTGSGTGLQTIYEYSCPYWTMLIGTDLFIRIIKDYQGVEKERYIVLKGTGAATMALKSNDIELSEGDYIKFSFSYKTSNSQPGAVNNVFEIGIYNGISNYYINQDGYWVLSGYGFTYSVRSGDNTNEWHDVVIESKYVPFDCIMNILLTQASFTSGQETHYKNFNFEVNYIVSGAGQVNGQQHTYYNLITLNNVVESDISIDTSPSATISGTLFLDNYTGIIRNRSKYWTYDGAVFGDFGTLGARILMEDLFIKYKPRYKYEGNLLNVFQPFPSNQIIGPETIFLYGNDLTNPIRLIFGKLSIDYKQGMADCTMLFDSNKDEDIEDIKANYLYEFKYLYENN